ncbi:MAG: flavodoxin [Clostridium sp.]|uniref:flavodoxin n=1 Tax=Clostridium sp. TaxID=1506 RepID=UPI0039ED9764
MSERKNILIVYFSYTGNTGKLANRIHENVGGDIIEIQPVTPYSDNYNAVVDQVLKEQKENYRPEIETKVDNIESYDVILIGSPIWWYEIAPPLKTFLEENDLSGKTVALFTTHGGYGKGKSDDNIAELCPQSTILESFSIEGTEVDSEQEDVSGWLHAINMVKE